MRRAFRIHHDPAPGETVQLVVDYLPEAMRPIGDGWWEANADVGEDSVYYYRAVADDGSVTRIDHGRPRRPLGEYVIIDRWRPADPARMARHSTLFKIGIGRHWPEARGASGLRLTLRLHEPSIRPGSRVAVIGSDPSLGAWDESGARRMTASPFPWWTLTVDLERPDEPGRYSYLIVDDAGTIIHRESDQLPLPPCPTSTVVTDERLRGLPDWRGTGVAVPVFSLRTARSFGVGDFADLAAFGQWASQCGISVIRILPLNDTISHHRWTDSNPYRPISVQALHPLYTDVRDLPGFGDLGADVMVLGTDLNAGSDVDYERVIRAKLNILRDVFDASEPDPQAVAFAEEHWDWLGPYAYWCTLRDRHGTPDMSAWGADAVFDPARLEAAKSDAEHRDLEFWCWVQFHLHRQLTSAVEQVHRLGIAIEGDLPIGVAVNGVETWTHPELFLGGRRAGTPPDGNAIRGRDWGVTTYDWDAMAADGYAWWKGRFVAMGRYADAYRIGQVSAFFRVWEIPEGAVDGLLGVLRPCRPLNREELMTHLPGADIAWLSRPTIDMDVLHRRFGATAPAVRERCFTGDAAALRFSDSLGSQAAIVDASEAGAFDGLGNRATVTRHLLDLRADAPLMEVPGGHHPRASWQATEAYQRLAPHERDAFDVMAIDFFHHRHTGLWRAQGMRTLPAVTDVTPLLPCGEDLAMVPEMVPALMADLGVLRVAVERTPERPGEWRSDPGDAPYLSVVTPDTHDMAPIRLWWSEARSAARRYWSEVLGGSGDAPLEATPDVCTAIVGSHLASPAMLAMFQLQDLLATVPGAAGPDPTNERINDPAVADHRWRYRCHLAVSDLPVRDWSRR